MNSLTKASCFLLVVTLLMLAFDLVTTYIVPMFNQAPPQIGDIYYFTHSSPFGGNVTMQIVEVTKDKNDQWWIKYHFCGNDDCTDLRWNSFVLSSDWYYLSTIYKKREKQ